MQKTDSELIWEAHVDSTQFSYFVLIPSEEYSDHFDNLGEIDVNVFNKLVGNQQVVPHETFVSDHRTTEYTAWMIFPEQDQVLLKVAGVVDEGFIKLNEYHLAQEISDLVRGSEMSPEDERDARGDWENDADRDDRRTNPEWFD